MKIKTKYFINTFLLLFLTVLLVKYFQSKNGVYIDKKYWYYWNYTFNGEYKIKRVQHEWGNKYGPENADYLIEYTDKNGFKHNGVVHGEPEGTDIEFEYYSIWDVADFVGSQVEYIIEDDFYKNVAPQIYPGVPTEINWKGSKCYDIAESDMSLNVGIGTNGGSFTFLIDHVSTEAEGYKLADCDLKSVGMDDLFDVHICLFLETNWITKEEFEKFEQLEKAYCDYVGKPCNYELTIYGKTNCIYEKEIVNGIENKERYSEPIFKENYNEYING
jgi:hypothetical protein